MAHNNWTGSSRELHQGGNNNIVSGLNTSRYAKYAHNDPSGFTIRPEDEESRRAAFDSALPSRRVQTDDDATRRQAKMEFQAAVTKVAACAANEPAVPSKVSTSTHGHGKVATTSNRTPVEKVDTKAHSKSPSNDRDTAMEHKDDLAHRTQYIPPHERKNITGNIEEPRRTETVVVANDYDIVCKGEEHQGRSDPVVTHDLNTVAIHDEAPRRHSEDMHEVLKSRLQEIVGATDDKVVADRKSSKPWSAMLKYEIKELRTALDLSQYTTGEIRKVAIHYEGMLEKALENQRQDRETLAVAQANAETLRDDLEGLEEKNCKLEGIFQQNRELLERCETAIGITKRQNAAFHKDITEKIGSILEHLLQALPEARVVPVTPHPSNAATATVPQQQNGTKPHDVKSSTVTTTASNVPTTGATVAHAIPIIRAPSHLGAQIATSKLPDDSERVNIKTENEARFTQWPLGTERVGGPAQVRRVKLSNLPAGCTLADISRIVWGGVIQSLNFKPGDSFANVLFLTHADCMKYYNATSNGIQWPEDTSRFIWVEKWDEVDVLNEYERDLPTTDTTRCVRVFNLSSAWTPTALERFAKQEGRTLERLIPGRDGRGRRTVEFRFASLMDAIRFRGHVSRDQDCEECNHGFVPDPCMTATGIHA